MIRAGASWCGPCITLKPMLIDAVKQHEGKLEYLYVDIDKHKNIAEMLRVSISINFIICNILTVFFV